MNDFSGIVLAGGKSRRMGTDKSELLLGDRSFLEIQIDKLKSLHAREILVSGKEISVPGIRCVPDLIPDLGPLGGFYSCFLSCRCRNALVLSVDTPLISVRTLEVLLHAHAEGSHDATILTKEGYPEPLLAVYNTAATGILKELLDRKTLAVRAFLDRIDCQYYAFDGDPEELLNCNTPEDFSRLPEDGRSSIGQSRYCRGHLR